ncbi:MAG TPA: hypothetical protein VGV87_22040 [Blastocatellia bacterium]|nr:hypothetical protein [Blastocatellia bacterium]
MNVMSRMPEPPEKGSIVEGSSFSAFDRIRRRLAWQAGIPASVLALALIVAAAASGPRTSSRPPAAPENLSAAEFSRLIRDLSEEGGYFRSDNFTSNETSYLHVVDKLRELGASGGAYLGVGPEQNFTYIAKVRPRIAFIVDIRRQAMIQHLMFKAIFHLASNRVQYLSLLLSKPLPKEKAPAADASVNEILAFFTQASADDRAYTANLAAIRKAIKDDFQVSLSEADQTSLDYVYKNFRNDGLEIAYRMDGMRGGFFPSLKDLIAQTDQNGKLGNFLATKEDYEFVRDLQRKNLVIPVVGDFGGKKALAAVGDYLRKNGFTVTAFYTSNVEQYLFQGGSFTGFAENVRKLPINERSLFIRAVPNTRFSHPAQLPGHRSTTLLEQMSVFLRDYDEKRYQTYSDLVTTHYIAAEAPK